jgi:hypothetical protein
MLKTMLGLLLPVVFACTPAPQANFFVGNVTPAPARINGELASISVEPASRDRAVDPLPPSLALFLPLWQATLQDALARKGTSRSGGVRRLSLKVKVLQYRVSGETLMLFARCQLFDNVAGNPIFNGHHDDCPTGQRRGRSERTARRGARAPNHPGEYRSVSRPVRSVRPAATPLATAHLINFPYPSTRGLASAIGRREISRRQCQEARNGQRPGLLRRAK